MALEIEKTQNLILKYLHDLSVKNGKVEYISAQDIQKNLGLEPLKVNQAVELLKSKGLVEWMRFMGNAPFTFGFVELTSRGEYEFQRKQSIIEVATLTGHEDAKMSSMTTGQLIQELSNLSLGKPPIPIGSPYGFSEQDWETVSLIKAKKDMLYVVFGCKFDSAYCDYKELAVNIRDMFEQTVNRYNTEKTANIKLKFEPLHAGYGEHLFNQIARDVISSDIAVFETSDMAPNIFIEIGVALNWGSRVFLIKNENCPIPPSDISGQTYADYKENGKIFNDTEHAEKLYRMVEQAIQKKG